MHEYYPGSSKQRKEYSEPEPEKPELDSLPDIGKPGLYAIGTKMVELYKIGSVAIALNRKSNTIRRWETQGIIPTSPYKMPSHDNRGARRLYSKQQIETLRQIAHEEDVLNPNEGGQWKHIEKTNFKAKAAKAFNLEGI